MINSFSDYLEVQMIVLNLKLSFVLTAISFILLSATPFQHQLTSASPASFSNKSYGSNVANGPAPLLPNVSLQNSTSPNLSAGDLAQKQALIMSHIQRHQPGIMQPQPNQPVPLSQQQPQQQLPNQFQPQLYPQQQQPFNQTQPQLQFQQSNTTLMQGQQGLTYQDPSMTYTILYPSNWITDPSAEGGIMFRAPSETFSDKYKINAAVTVSKNGLPSAANSLQALTEYKLGIAQNIIDQKEQYWQDCQRI